MLGEARISEGHPFGNEKTVVRAKTNNVDEAAMNLSSTMGAIFVIR